VSGTTDTWSVLQPVNGAEATLYGFEWSVQRRLDFLPGQLARLNAYFNYTYTHSTTDNPAFGDREVELPGAAPHTLNSSLTWQDESLVVGLSYNYNAAYLDPGEVDLTPGLERYYDQTHYLDFNTAYLVSPGLARVLRGQQPAQPAPALLRRRPGSHGPGRVLRPPVEPGPEVRPVSRGETSMRRAFPQDCRLTASCLPAARGCPPGSRPGRR
jgi:outer membrane receptor protein involved in Fe transport